MNRLYKKDVQEVVDDLNRKYKFNDSTYCKFNLRTGYGGYRIVLSLNMSYGSAETCITTNFLSARECLNSLYEKAFYNEIEKEIEYMIYLAKLYSRKQR